MELRAKPCVTQFTYEPYTQRLKVFPHCQMSHCLPCKFLFFYVISNESKEFMQEAQHTQQTATEQHVTKTKTARM